MSKYFRTPDEDEEVLLRLFRGITNPGLNKEQKAVAAEFCFGLLDLTALKHDVSLSEALDTIERYEEAHPDPMMEEPFMKESKEEEIFWDYINEFDE